MFAKKSGWKTTLEIYKASASIQDLYSGNTI